MLDKTLLKPKELRKALGIGDGKYYRLVKQGMPSRNLTSAECKRHTRRYVLEEVLTWLESMQKGANHV